MNFYTGVGSRTTPDHILLKMENIAKLFAKNGWTLRSGGADGADDAFERGCVSAKGSKEIYLPWRNFNGRPSGPDYYTFIPDFAFGMAACYHPVWDTLSDGAKRCHARNVMQVMGATGEQPSSFLVCWTPTLKRGGTRTAVLIAKTHGVPVWNLHDPAHEKKFSDDLAEEILRAVDQPVSEPVGATS